MKELTSRELATWALAGAAQAWILSLGMAFIGATMVKTPLLEEYPAFIPMVLLMLGLTALWFFFRLHYLVLGATRLAWPEYARTAQRTAIVSSVAAVEIPIAVLGIALLRIGNTVAGFVCLTLATLMLVLLVRFIIRRYRPNGPAPVASGDRSLVGPFSGGAVGGAAALLLITGLGELHSGSMSVALIFLPSAIVLVAVNVACGIRLIQKREEQLPPENRVFTVAMAIFGVSAMAIALFLTGGALFLSRCSPFYGIGALLLCAVFLYLLWRTTKRAEERFRTTNA